MPSSEGNIVQKCVQNIINYPRKTTVKGAKSNNADRINKTKLMTQKAVQILFYLKGVVVK